VPYEPKTKVTAVDVDGFIAGSAKPADGAALCALMRRVSGLEPKMWGPTIVGFGEREYDLAGGKKGRVLAMGFSPRATRSPSFRTCVARSTPLTERTWSTAISSRETSSCAKTGSPRCSISV